MDDSKFNKYKISYDILNLAMEKAINLCHEMKDIDYICRESDKLMKDELNKCFKKLDVMKTQLIPGPILKKYCS